MWQLFDHCPRCGGIGRWHAADDYYGTSAMVCEQCSESWDVW